LKTEIFSSSESVFAPSQVNVLGVAFDIKLIIADCGSAAAYTFESIVLLLS
jgi:hypothetical protein